MSTDTFFDDQTDQSLVKAEIVEKYFDTWAKIITGSQGPGARHRIAYVDLFAGPGRYKDGGVSTPLRVLQKAIANPTVAQRLVTIFNDKDAENIDSLKAAVAALPGIEKLEHEPQFWNIEVGEDIAVAFRKLETVPLLAFIDPWGYKGLTLPLVSAVLKDWGCDCIFFFNYKRINAGLSNPLFHENMCALFGEERATRLQVELERLDPKTREATVVNELALSLKEHGGSFVLPFCFKNAEGTRTTHHLIHVTKSFKGYEVMKNILSKYSPSLERGASFTFCPATDRQQLLLFELSRPLADLRAMLQEDFAGRSLTMVEIYREHSVDRPYLKNHYKDALTALEKAGLIVTAGRKSQRGFADDIRVTFPPKRFTT